MPGDLALLVGDDVGKLVEKLASCRCFRFLINGGVRKAGSRDFPPPPPPPAPLRAISGDVVATVSCGATLATPVVIAGSSSCEVNSSADWLNRLRLRPSSAIKNLHNCIINSD